jgi:uncharacterized protein
VRKRSIAGVIFLVLVAGILIWGFLVEPSRIDVHHITISDGVLGNALSGNTLVFVSDFHLGNTVSQGPAVLKVLNGLMPDFVFLGGDYVKWNSGYEKALDLFSNVHAKRGVWAVMGDYDYSNSRKSCLYCHEPNSGRPTKVHSIKFLRNSSDKIDTSQGPVWIYGIDREADGEWFSAKTVAELKGKTPSIVLSHSPLAFNLIDENRNVLVLAGDTHGGQIPLPSWLWKLLGYNKNAQYEKGWFEKGKKKMYVSRGVGTSHFPFRFMRPPEITVFHFQ